MTDLERTLRGWVTDWNGEPMQRGEPPRDGIYCDVIYDAISEIVALRDQLDTLTAAYNGLADSIRSAVAESVRVAQARIYREGAEEMQERAAQTAMDHEAPTTARAILALPLTPEEPI